MMKHVRDEDRSDLEGSHMGRDRCVGEVLKCSRAVSAEFSKILKSSMWKFLKVCEKHTEGVNKLR